MEYEIDKIVAKRVRNNQVVIIIFDMYIFPVIHTIKFIFLL